MVELALLARRTSPLALGSAGTVARSERYGSDVYSWRAARLTFLSFHHARRSHNRRCHKVLISWAGWSCCRPVPETSLKNPGPWHRRRSNSPGGRAVREVAAAFQPSARRGKAHAEAAEPVTFPQMPSPRRLITIMTPNFYLSADRPAISSQCSSHLSPFLQSACQASMLP